MRLAVLRADASAAAGAGHVMRSTAILEVARAAGWEVELWGSIETSLARDVVDDLRIPVLAPPPDRELMATARARGADVLHVDHYGLPDLMAGSPAGPLLSAMVDGRHGRRRADLVIDPSPTALERFDEIYADAAVFLGPDAVPLRGSVVAAAAEPNHSVPGHVLVVLGGTDAHGLADRLAREVATLPWVQRVRVIIPGLPAPEVVNGSGTPIERLPPSRDLPRLARRHQAVVSAAGTTVWELLALGVAGGVVQVADNQHDNYTWVTGHHGLLPLGSTVDGWHVDLAPLAVAPQPPRPRPGPVASGSRRIVDTWEALCVRRRNRAGSVRLRPAGPEDAGRLLAWRNDPIARSASRTTDELAWPDHLAWLSRHLDRRGDRILVVEDGPHAVGTVRRAQVSPGTWEVSVAMAPAHRGRGHGRRAIDLLLEECRADAEVRVVRAAVRTDNPASRRLFEAAGFDLTGSPEPGWVQYDRRLRPGPS